MGRGRPRPGRGPAALPARRRLRASLRALSDNDFWLLTSVSSFSRLYGVKLLRPLFWAAVAAAAAVCLGGVALYRGEHINSIWLVAAAACSYATGYRFYAKFIAARVMTLNDQRATPAERLRNGHDFEPTNKWIVFGHHFAAIAGPGPLVGPVLAAQFGYLPGTLWIIIGAVAGRRGAGFRDPVRLHAARRQIAGPDGARGDRQGRRLHRAGYGVC